MPAPEDFWFPAKSRGWGWGPPVVWQGWLVLAVYFVLVLVALLALDRPKGLAISFLLTLLLVAICWLKGEKPGWR